MTDQMKPIDRKIALFVDLENFIISSANIGVEIDLDRIIEKLLEYGNVIVRRGFGDLDSACRNNQYLRNGIRKKLSRASIQIEDIPYVSKHKNTADMRLVVEALSFAYSSTLIDTFAILSDDRDYMPLVQKLRELGKFTIGIGMSPETVNKLWVNECDVFIYYSSLFSRKLSDDEETIPSEVELEDYLNLLCRAMKMLISKGAVTVAAAVAPQMRLIRPDFDYRLVGLGSFRDLIDKAVERQIIVVEPFGGDIVLQPSTRFADIGERGVENFKNKEPLEIRNTYLKYFKSKLKCDIPSTKMREKLYNVLASSLREAKSLSLGTNLNALAYKIVNEVPKLLQAQAYKILYSLFRAHAFSIEFSDQPFNPILTALSADEDNLDFLFISNCIKVLHDDKPEWPFRTEQLAEVFDVDIKLIEEIVEEHIF